MTILTILKIITRSWWRNKVFFFISIVSLAIGLACTNLLFTYYVHDYNIDWQSGQEPYFLSASG